MKRPLGIAALLLLTLAAPAHAVLRSPQVPVTGTALQAILNAQGQKISVATDQRYATGFWGLFLTRPPTHFYVHSIRPNGEALALFDLNAPSPAPLYVIAAQGMGIGWFTEVSFRDSPERMVVNLFDENGSLMGTTTYLGLGFDYLGVAITGPGGVFYPYDELNADGRAHVLAYWGTGQYQGGTWLCAESHTEADGGDFDFADAVFLLEALNVTPVRRTTWGALKQRFR